MRMLRDADLLHIPRVYKDIRSSLLRHGFTIPLSDMEIDVLLQEGKFSRRQLLDYSEPEILSLDYSTTDDENTSLSDIIPSLETSNFDSRLSEDAIEDIIDKALLYIKPRHRGLVEEWMYAAVYGMRLTQDTLGKKYNISQSYVNRIINSAISVIKMHDREIREMFGY